MKRSKFTEEQIAFALHQADTGTAVAEVCRKVGITMSNPWGRSPTTHYQLATCLKMAVRLIFRFDEFDESGGFFERWLVN